VQIFLELTQDPGGRLSGSASLTRPPSQRPALQFSGTLELLAALEELCRNASPTATANFDQTLPAQPSSRPNGSDVELTAKDPS
jgi:hypothetical protein